MRLPLLIVATLLIPLANAGTPEAPEVVDDAGDCELLPGNEYADIVSAWISDETADAFNVNIAIAKFNDLLGPFAGFALQFEHQGIRFGVAGLYSGPDGWVYGTGYIDFETGEVNNWTDVEGSFAPGTPAVLTIPFAKSNFPHANMADNSLRGFVGGSADFKPGAPFFVAPPPVEWPLPTFHMCDDVESAATYDFAVGSHSMGAAGASANATVAADGASTSVEGGGQEIVATAADGGDAPSNDTPGPAVAVIVGLVALAAAARRRR